MSNSLDPDQARHFVGPNLGPNCLQRLSADDKICRWQAKSYSYVSERIHTLKHEMYVSRIDILFIYGEFFTFQWASESL